MRVLHLSSSRSWRGGERQIANLIEAAAPLGIDGLVGARRGSALERHCRENALRCFSLGYRSELDLWSAQRVHRFCRSEGIAIVHAHDGPAHSIAVWAKLMGCPAPLVVHRRVASALRSNPLTRFKLDPRRTDAIVCISEHIAGIVRPALRQPERCATIRDGIALERFAGTHVRGKLRRELGAPDGAALIGNASALSAEKDHRTFADAAAELLGRGADARFAIIGGGAQRAAIDAYVRDRGLADRIFLTGHRGDLPEILGDLDVFLVTSSKEGLGTTVLDAFAAGVPVVATRAGGIPEIVIHGETGLLAAIGDANGLADQVERYLAEPALRDAVRRRARELLERDFTREVMARRTCDLYRRVLAEHGAGAERQLP